MRMDDNWAKRIANLSLYCASGGRSSYAVQMLRAYGFTNLENGGGLMKMLARVKRG
jgi:rhodanese-related sulfurtransferase